MPCTCFSQISFYPAITYITGSYPQFVCVGDLNNDGLDDVVLATGSNDISDPPNDFNLFVYIQNDSGNLSFPIKYPYPGISYSYPYDPGIRAIAMGDLNSDSLNDIAIAIYDSIGIFYQNPSGTMDPLQMYYSGNDNRTVGLSIGDLNSDSLNDIAASHEGTDRVGPVVISILTQKSTGGFSETIYDAPQGGLNQILVKDINNDRLNDAILMTGGITGGIYVYTQNGSGGLNNYVSYPVFPNYVDYVGGFDIGDLNNDGLNDLVKTIQYNYIALVLQDPANNLLQPPFSISSPRFRLSVKIADLNCDGRNEITVPPAGGWDSLLVYEQDIHNQYNTYTSFQIPVTSSNPQDIDIGDLNHDGRKDIALACQSGLVVLISNSEQYDICCRPPKKPDPISGDTLICQGINASEFFTGEAVPGDSLIWLILPAQAGDVISAKQASCTVRWNTTITGIRRVVVKAVNSCASICSDTLFVTIEKLRDQMLGKDTVICPDKPIILRAGNGFANFKWQDGSTDSIFKVVYGGIYFVATSDYCGVVYDTIEIKDISLPGDIKLNGETMICAEGVISVYRTYQHNTDTIIWHIFPSQAGSIYLSGKDSCMIAWKDSWRGMAEVFAEAVNSCGRSFSDTLLVYSGRMPDLDLGSDTVLCSGNTFELMAGSGFESYTWQDNSHDSSLMITKGGVYYIMAKHPCGSRWDTVVVRDTPLPVLRMPQDTVLCAGTTLTFDVTLPGISRYRWQDNNSGPVYRVQQPGEYSVTITDSNLCSNSGVVRVNELQDPVVGWPEDTMICAGNTLILNADNPFSTYNWHDGTSQSSHPVTESGEYRVTVTNLCGSADASISVTISECVSYLDVPSAFSPNGDGLNDELYAVGLYVDNVHFVILNRWGQIVFETNSLASGWDGTLKGRALEPGVFVFSVTARSTVDGHPVEKNGNVTLIR
jgi:gliding motility-associated-like protein